MLSRVTDFDWDIVYVDRTPYSSGSKIKEEYGIEGEFQPLLTDFSSRVAFCKDGKLVYDLELNNFYFEFDTLEIIKPDSVFTVLWVSMPGQETAKLLLQQYEDAIAHLSHSSAAVALISLLTDSTEVYTIAFNNGGNGSYAHATRTINWDPTSGLVMQNKTAVQSAALGLAHEMGHASQHLSGFFRTYRTRDEVEANNLKVHETPITKQLGEPVRNNYKNNKGALRMNNSIHYITTKWSPGWVPWKWFNSSKIIMEHNIILFHGME